MAMTWRKSSYSVANGACVEVCVDGEGDDTVMVRDSKDPDGSILTYGRESWSRFVEDIKAGRVRP